MTVGEREILFVDPKETDQLIGRVLAGNFIAFIEQIYTLRQMFPHFAVYNWCILYIHYYSHMEINIFSYFFLISLYFFLSKSQCFAWFFFAIYMYEKFCGI